MKRRGQENRKEVDLDTICEEKLLEQRICDLPLNIQGTWIEECIQSLYHDLDAKQILFRPICYLAEEWLTPENEPVVGIPFFLAHPTLMRLERRFMFEVEGGTKSWCLKLLRHETGHAICYAYQLNKRKKWKEVFGESSEEYSDTYRFRPYSKNFVRHLEDYYAQYHPDEDFAETFAVWLTPGLQWQTQYKGWKALEKLKFVDELMREIKFQEPLRKKGVQYWRGATLRATLKTYYKKKRHYYAEDFPDFHDANLKRIFVLIGIEQFNGRQENMTKIFVVGDIIRKYRRSIIESISKWTGEKKYLIDDLLKTVGRRCRELKLGTLEAESVAVLRLTIYITTLIMNHRYTGKFRGEKLRNRRIYSV